MREEMDVETLQAQIDLSNSISYDIVSSWVKPAASSTLKESASRAMSRELEAFVKRPPRLGLGATVPKSTLATAREAVMLKGKLVSRTRSRAEGSDIGTATMNGKPDINEDDDNEDESRSAAISTRKGQVNGHQVLGLGKHKKHHGKKKAQLTEVKPTTSVNAKEAVDEIKEPSNPGVSQDHDSSSPSKPNPFVIPQTTSSPKKDYILSLPTISHQATPSRPKKRKRKSRGKHESHLAEDDSAPMEVEEWTGFSN